ncbi:MAG: hypothetical protein OCC49_00675 [Fibrobacterales bacterium]
MKAFKLLCTFFILYFITECSFEEVLITDVHSRNSLPLLKSEARNNDTILTISSPFSCVVAEQNFIAGSSEIIAGARSYQIPYADQIIEIKEINNYRDIDASQPYTIALVIAQINGTLHGYEVLNNCEVTGIYNQIQGDGSLLRNQSLLALPDPDVDIEDLTITWEGFMDAQGEALSLTYHIAEFKESYKIPFSQFFENRLWYGTIRSITPILSTKKTTLGCQVDERSFNGNKSLTIDNSNAFQIPTSENILDLFIFNRGERGQFKHSKVPFKKRVVGTFIAQIDGRLHSYSLHRDCSVTGLARQELPNDSIVHNISLIAQPGNGAGNTFGVSNGYTYEWLGWVEYKSWRYNMSFRIVELDQTYIVPFRGNYGGKLRFNAPHRYDVCHQLPLTSKSVRPGPLGKRIKRGRSVKLWVNRFHGCTDDNNGFEYYNVESPNTLYRWYNSRGKRIGTGQSIWIKPRRTDTYTIIAKDVSTGKKARAYIKVKVQK